MIKYFILFISCLFLFVACNRNENSQTQIDSEIKINDSISLKKDSIFVSDTLNPTQLSKKDTFLLIVNDFKIKLDTSIYRFFKDTSFTNLHIYSPDLNSNISQLFIGKTIPGKCFRFFKANDFELEYQKGGYKIFACYKFKFNHNKTGLIIRTPPMYSETAIRLVIVNDKNIIEDNLEIANGFGDGGWSFNKDAWIENNLTDSLVIISRKRDKWMDDNMEKTYYSDSLERYTYLNPDFKMRRGIFNLDTVKYKLKYW